MFSHKLSCFTLVSLLFVPTISSAADEIDAATSAALASIVSTAGPQNTPPPTLGPQSKPSPRVSPEAAEISTINQRIAVMSARLAELEIQAKIKAKETELAKGSSSESSFSQIDDNVIPSVSEISGIDNKIWAVLNVRGGTQTVRVGEVAAGWKVTNIKSDSVTVEKKGRKHLLSFGSSVIQIPDHNQPANAAPVPPMGGMPGFPGR